MLLCMCACVCMFSSLSCRVERALLLGGPSCEWWAFYLGQLYVGNAAVRGVLLVYPGQWICVSRYTPVRQRQPALGHFICVYLLLLLLLLVTRYCHIHTHTHTNHIATTIVNLHLPKDCVNYNNYYYKCLLFSGCVCISYNTGQISRIRNQTSSRIRPLIGDYTSRCLSGRDTRPMYCSDASMAATVDSGNETLFSDDSSCDLVMSPSACEADVSRSDDSTDMPPPRVAPPKIQPYSGVLEKGKIVIRPIAFKPVGMTPAARFGVAGERYGSTPILARPGSHLVHYGSSSDLRHHHHHHHHHHSTNSNYSLDRKLLSSASSSPPLAMASLTSLPHKLINYDSMESVRKSPSSTVDSNTNKSSSYCLSGTGGGSLLDLTPSPSDSGVSELEAALRDRDSELAYLRQTMEHNEQVIFRVYQEKERVWERELRRMKSVHENRLRASAQKALKLEQMLMMQTYQLQQDKKRLCAEAQRASTQVDQLREEVDALRTRLEETEWSLCQKTGEISLLKTQLKDSQSEQTTKGHELLQLRGEFRDVKENLERREKEVQSLRQEAKDRDTEIERLRAEVKSLNAQLRESTAAANHRQARDAAETERLKAEVRELREELSEVAMSEYEGVEAGRSMRSLKHLEYTDDVIPAETAEDIEIQRLNGELPEARLSAHHCAEMERLQEEMVLRRKDFDQERVTWAQEKEKVLRYQRQLQLNYVQMFRRTRALEAEVESLTLELELNTKGGIKKPMSLDMSQTVEL